MPQGRPLSDTVTAAILASIDEGKSRNDVAREHGVSPSTVTRTAAANGRTFDRTKTKSATEAAQADAASTRVSLATASLVVAEKALQRIEAALPKASAKDAAIAYGIVIDKHIALERHDTVTGVDEIGSLLGDLFDDMRARRAPAE